MIIEKIGECNDKDTERKRILYDNFLNVEPFQFVADYLPSLPYIIQEDEIIKRLDIRYVLIKFINKNFLILKSSYIKIHSDLILHYYYHLFFLYILIFQHLLILHILF